MFKTMHGKTKQFDGKKKEQIFSILFLNNKKDGILTTFNNGCLGSLYSMTNVANYDNLCELQNNVNHRDFERK
jgi:hypothetical protein